MKTHAFALILLSFTIAAGVQWNPIGSQASAPVAPPPTAYTEVGTVINVYFVSGMFSAEQRKALWDAMHNWKSSRKSVAQVTFVDVGETNGVIDCQSCLTVAREEIFTGSRKWRSSFNRLRQDHTGRLVSAWIGLDRTTNTTAGLRELMLKALERGFGAA